MSTSRDDLAATTLDDAQHAFLLREGPDALARHGESVIAAEQRRGRDRVIGSTIALFGLAVLGWPAAPLALFVLLGLVAVWLADVVKLCVAHQHVVDGEQARLADAEVWVLVADGSARGASRRRLYLAPWAQLALAGWLLAGLAYTVIYEAQRLDGIDLVTLAVAHPDMLAVLGATLVWQLGTTAYAAHRQLRAEQAVCFEPLLDAVCHAAIVFLWMVCGSIAVELAAVLRGTAPPALGMAVLVVSTHLVLVWRGLGELATAAAARRRAERLGQVLSAGQRRAH